MNKEYDIFYISMAISDKAFFKDAIYLILAKIFIKRRIIHFHSKGLKKRLKHKGTKFLIEKFYSTIFKDCELIHLSKSLLDDLQIDHFKSIHIIPNGIDDKFIYKKNSIKEYQVLFLSNIIKTKGIFILLKALNLIKIKKIKIKACIAGASHNFFTDQKVIDLIKKYNLQTNINLIGPVYGEDKKDLLNKSQIFVLPTILDCMPLTIIEAMSFEMPIISTRVGAIPEMLDFGDCGKIISQNNPYELADSIMYLLDNPKEAKRLGQKARIKYLDNFKSEKFINNFKKILYL